MLLLLLFIFALNECTPVFKETTIHNTHLHTHTHTPMQTCTRTWQGQPGDGLLYMRGGCERKYNAHFTYLHYTMTICKGSGAGAGAGCIQVFHYVLCLFALIAFAHFVIYGFKAVAELRLPY